MSAVAAYRERPTPERVVLTCVESAPREAGALVAGDGEPVVMLHASLSAKSQWTLLARPGGKTSAAKFPAAVANQTPTKNYLPLDNARAQ